MNKCNFHLGEDSVSSCSRCYRFICSQDQEYIKRTMEDIQDSYIKNEDYCVICHYDVEIQKTKSKGESIFVISFLSIFIIVPLTMLIFIFSIFEGDEFFALFFIVPFFLIFMSIPAVVIFKTIKLIKTAPDRAEMMRNTKEQFLNDFGELPNGIAKVNEKTNHFKWTNTKLNCFQCGNEIFLSNSFCSECGDPTTDEKDAYRNKLQTE